MIRLLTRPAELLKKVGSLDLSQENSDDIINKASDTFHQVAVVIGIWVVALCVGVHTLSSMRAILVPLFWAFFIMMGLVPATDAVESGLLRLTACCRSKDRDLKVIPAESRVGFSNYAGIAGSQQAYEADEDVVACPGGCGFQVTGHPTHCCNGCAENQGHGSRCERKPMPGQGHVDCHHTIVRSLAVLIVACSFIGVVMGFFVLIYVSALHMQENWIHYEEGTKKLGKTADGLISRYAHYLPPGALDKLYAKASAGLEEVLSSSLSLILENVGESLFSALMMLLYMIFWLCQPMHVGQNTTMVFKHYIVLKTLASAGYAFCIFLVLHFYKIDLAIVFGLITFLFNFVPEVGPFLAMVFPCPIVLFDGRMETPVLTLASVLGCNLLLKFVWANIIEVKLVEAQESMKMHPVVILFFVAFFGWIWGATGMLLSVPVVAVVKASMHLVPTMYRDPILVVLEGDRRAPANYEKWRSTYSVGLAAQSSPSLSS